MMKYKELDTMTDRAKAILQLQRAYHFMSQAKKNLQNIGAPPTIRGTAATIEELTADLLEYIKAERTESAADGGEC